MQDDTRDALLIAVAEALLNGVKGFDMINGSIWKLYPPAELPALLAKAKHEQDRPNDRGA